MALQAHEMESGMDLFALTILIFKWYQIPVPCGFSLETNAKFHHISSFLGSDIFPFHSGDSYLEIKSLQ